MSTKKQTTQKANTYKPPQSVLTKYAHVFVDFALGQEKGINKGDVVFVQFDAPALRLALAVQKRILEQGGHPIMRMSEEAFQQQYIELASNEQLDFFPKDYYKSLVDTIDHRMALMAPRDPFLLKDAQPEKLMRANKSMALVKKWIFAKQDRGQLTWTLGLYGTEGLAKEAGLSLEEFWAQIRKACFLDEDNPVEKWRTVSAEIREIRDTLSALPIDTLNVRSKDTDLTVKMGSDRQWLAGNGNNIPSFEIFTSPDWRGTEGHIYFDYPLYRYGNIIKDIRLTFKDGKVVKASAGKNEHLLKELIKQENADKIGEYSLTDRRYSKIDTFMANTLYDENYGGEWGNTHLALGSSYHDAYTGSKEGMEDDDWAELGFNESPEHTDIMATNDREVEATMKDGSKKIIYAKGEFQV